jgi:hypothetical protein
MIPLVLNSKIFATYQFAETPHIIETSHTIISEKKQIVEVLMFGIYENNFIHR